MKILKNKSEKFSRGVSTLDFIKVNLRMNLILLIIIIFGNSIYGGHSILDLVDPTFNPQIQTNSYGTKWVNAVQTTADGKILALGGFNTYNRVPVGKFLRLNADGSLDTSFNNQTVTAINTPGSGRILVQPDGKIVINAVGLVAGGQGPRPLFRLNADGSLDTTFAYNQTGFIGVAALDSLGRILLLGDNFTTPNGSRRIIRLNEDGSIDTSFNYTLPTGASLQGMVIQGNRPIVITDIINNRRIYRLNEDGSEDASFTPVTGLQLYIAPVQPDNKILYRQETMLMRLNENGSPDNSFQPINLSVAGNESLIKFTGDGKLVFITSSSPATFRRFLPNGAVDPSFIPFTTTTYASYTIQSGDKIVMGDGMPFAPSGANNFVRLTSDGTIDPTFNPGGTGFQNVQPGILQSIETYPDGKILLGGKFDVINDISRSALARINPDSTVDTTFRVNMTSGSGNYFSIIRDVYQIRTQTDGKIIISGFFDYFLNGILKKNLVRLNSDGSIDASFDLTHPIPDYSQIILGGQNRFAVFSDGKLMVGTSKSGSVEVPGPVKLTEAGARDTTFNPTLNGTSTSLYYEDVAIQPDGKIIAAGSFTVSSNVFRSFVARLNPDGTLDPTFPYTDESGRLKMRLILLSDGKILVSKSNHPGGGSARVQRLFSNGGLDTSFNNLQLTDTAARFNALLVLPNGKIFVGGSFTATINGQPGRNLLQLDADGNFEPTVYNLNNEVLALAADSEGRVLVGGGFTVISSNNNSGLTRSYVARLTDSDAQFDFDGDGRSDLGVFNPADGTWSIRKSQTNQTIAAQFGLPGDKTVPADYDGDGKDDLAVFRPSEGIWYILQSLEGFKAVRWGINGDKPVAGDFDGDDRADFAVWRPDSGVWYVLQSSDNQVIVLKFGLTGDIPLARVDFDGDDKSDIAVWRPSDGNFYWLESGSNYQFKAVHFGTNGDIPTPADYNGDGKTDLAVYRPSEGNWYQYLTSPNGVYNYSVIRFGASGDVPIPADYDGDSKTDIALWRQGTWHLLMSNQGYISENFGGTNVQAVAAFSNQ